MCAARGNLAAGLARGGFACGGLRCVGMSSRWDGRFLHAGACRKRVASWWVLRTALGVASGQVGVVFVVASRAFVTIVVAGLVSSLSPVLVSSASLVSSVVAIVLAAVVAAIVVGGGVLHAALVVVGSCAPCLSGHDGDCRRRVGVVAGLRVWELRDGSDGGTFDEMMVNGDDFAHTFDEFVTKDQTPSKGEKAVEVKDADADENIKKRQTTKRDLDFNCLLQHWKNSRYRGEVSLAYILHCIALTSLFPLRHTAFISHMALTAPTLSPHQECKTAVSTLPFLMSEPHKKASKRGGNTSSMAPQAVLNHRRHCPPTPSFDATAPAVATSSILVVILRFLEPVHSLHLTSSYYPFTDQRVPAVRVYKTPLIFGLLEYSDLAHPPSSTSPKPPMRAPRAHSNDYDTATAGCAPKQAMTAGTSTSQLQPRGPPCDDHYPNRHLNHDHHVTTAPYYIVLTLIIDITRPPPHMHPQSHNCRCGPPHADNKDSDTAVGCAPTQVEETTTMVTTTTERRQQRDDDEHRWCSGAAK
ncbi:hypothetical protein EDB84DRAFT_1608707 [Lactarius hengduanensis]|nr:hypothetical protein EDB84DRAFT_1608707 [Lactarius hengduanensis]